MSKDNETIAEIISENENEKSNDTDIVKMPAIKVSRSQPTDKSRLWIEPID
jgi:hypothetical protein